MSAAREAELERLRAAHPTFTGVADTLLDLAGDPSVSVDVYDRVCAAVFTVLTAWAERRDPLEGTPFAASPARRGLDVLLFAHPHLELVEAEWQNGGPWLLVTLGQRSDAASTDALDVFARYPFAVFKRTGAVHGMHGGAVTDDPILEP